MTVSNKVPNILPAPTNLTVTPGDGKLDLSWTAPAGTISYYVVHYTSSQTVADEAGPTTTLDDAVGWKTGNSFAASATSGSITGLTNGREYRVRLRASDANAVNGMSAHGKGTPQAATPRAPTGLGVTPGNTRLDLSWTAPATGAAVSGYDVHYTSNSTVAADAAVQTGTAAAGWVAVSRSGTTTSQAITSLTNNTAYRVRVRAKNAAGSSGWLAGTGTPKAQTLRLSGLALSVGSDAVTLVPSFAAARTSYTASVPHATTAVSVTPSWGGTPPTDLDVQVSSATANRDSVVTNQVTVSASGTAHSMTLASSGDTWIDLSMSSATLGVTTNYLVVVSKLPPPATVTLSASPNPVPEGGPVTVTATLSLAAVSALSIPVTVSTAAPNTAEPIDVGALTSISIASGQTTGTGIIATNQDIDAGDETFTVALGTPLPTGITGGTPSSVTVTITDDEVGTVTLSASPNPVTEGQTVTVTARLSTAAASTLTIPVTVTPGTAQSGDIGTLASISIAKGQLAGTGTITTNHDVDDEDETFTVALGALPDGYAAGSPVTVTIRDDEKNREDEVPPLVTDLRVTPGDGQLTVTWTVPPGLTRFDIKGYHVQYRESVCTKPKRISYVDANGRTVLGDDGLPDLVPVTQDGVPAYVHCDPSNPNNPGKWHPHGGWAGSWDPIARQTSRDIAGLVPSVDYDVRVAVHTSKNRASPSEFTFEEGEFVLATGTPFGDDSDARLRRMGLE